jgi:hypothetical protein
MPLDFPLLGWTSAIFALSKGMPQSSGLQECQHRPALITAEFSQAHGPDRAGGMSHERHPQEVRLVEKWRKSRLVQPVGSRPTVCHAERAFRGTLLPRRRRCEPRGLEIGIELTVQLDRCPPIPDVGALSTTPRPRSLRTAGNHRHGSQKQAQHQDLTCPIHEAAVP